MSSAFLLVPFSHIPLEITGLILHPSHFEASDGRSIALVCRDWRDLGQAIAWRTLVLRSDAAGRFPQLHHSPLLQCSSAHLGRHVRYLELERDYWAGPRDDQPSLGDLEFGITSIRALLLTCSALEMFSARNSGPLMFRSTLEGLTSSEMTLKQLAWWDDNHAGSATLPLHFSLSELLRRLFKFTKLRRLVMAHLPPLAGDDDLPVGQYLALDDVTLIDRPWERGEPSKSEAVMPLLSKALLRKASFAAFMNPGLVRALSINRFRLTALSLDFHSTTLSHFFNSSISMLPHHPHLRQLTLGGYIEPNDPYAFDYEKSGVALPRRFLDAFPPKLGRIVVDLRTRVHDTGLPSFLRDHQ